MGVENETRLSTIIVIMYMYIWGKTLNSKVYGINFCISCAHSFMILFYSR